MVKRVDGGARRKHSLWGDVGVLGLRERDRSCLPFSSQILSVRMTSTSCLTLFQVLFEMPRLYISSTTFIVWVLLFDHRFTMTNIPIPVSVKHFNIPAYTVYWKVDDHIYIMMDVGTTARRTSKISSAGTSCTMPRISGISTQHGVHKAGRADDLYENWFVVEGVTLRYGDLMFELSWVVSCIYIGLE